MKNEDKKDLLICVSFKKVLLLLSTFTLNPKKFRLLWIQFLKSRVFYGFKSKKVLFFLDFPLKVCTFAPS